MESLLGPGIEPASHVARQIPYYWAIREVPKWVLHFTHSLSIFKKIQKTLRRYIKSELSRCNLIFIWFLLGIQKTFDDSALPELHHYAPKVNFWSLFVCPNSICLGFENSYFIIFQNLQRKKCFQTHSTRAGFLLLQLCLTLCDPIHSSPLGSPVPGILQSRTLEWVAISFSNAWKWKVKVKSLSHVWLFATPWTAVHQAPPSMGFSRQEHWSGVPLPSPLISLPCI